MKIAVLIPITSNMRNWTTFKDTDLLNIFIKSFFTTYTSNFKYKIFLGYDDNDKLYCQESVQNDIKRTINIMKNSEVELFPFNHYKYKGKPCWIWNDLFKEAIKEDFDYYVQCGSDIKFLDKGWVQECIETLQKSNDIGVVGLKDMNRVRFNRKDDLLTQTIVSKKHFDIFGFYFPYMIHSWTCDNWIGDIYRIHNLKYIINHQLDNQGGEPRYEVPSNYREVYKKSMHKYRNYILDYKKNNK